MKTKLSVLPLVLFALLFSVHCVNAAPPIKCPAGYTCTPNPVPASGASARVDGQPKLELKYDSNKNEAQLNATFRVTIDGGTTGLYLYHWSGFMGLIDQKGNYGGGYLFIRDISPIGKVSRVTDSYGQELFVVPAGKKAQFEFVGSGNPRTMFPGTYSVILTDIYVVTNIQSDKSNGYSLSVSGKNQTNSKTIIGEISPYITGIIGNQPFTQGATVMLSGQKMTGSTLLIDGVVRSDIPLTIKPDGVTIIFTLPAGLADGWHWLSVQNSNGMSNSVGFQVADPNAPKLKVTSPNGGEGWQVGKTYSVTYSSTNITSPNSVWIYLQKYNDTGYADKGYLLGKSDTNNGEFPVTISSDVIASMGGAGGTYKIRVWSDAPGNPEDTSDNYFSILECPDGYTCASSVTPLISPTSSTKQTSSVWNAVINFVTGR